MLSIKDFSFCYAAQKHTAIKNINLEIREGDFMLVCGRSGSGKTTLLHCLKKSIKPVGICSGQIDTTLDSAEIAIVFQNPDHQLVNNTVLADLAFAMENSGISSAIMRRRMAEMVGFFGIEEILHTDPTQLSGGQKQLVVLCAAMMTRPKLLLLDEPISQLDPIHAQQVLDILVRLNSDLGVTIVMVEHRLDECISRADKLVCMDHGEIIYSGAVKTCLKKMLENNYLQLFVPDIPRLSSILTQGEKQCLDYKEWKQEIGQYNASVLPLKNICHTQGDKILTADNLFFAYQDSQDYVIRNLSMTINQGSMICLFGGNGSGKTTFLKLLAGIYRPLHGRIKHHKLKICYFPQDVYSYFRFEHVREEFAFDCPCAFEEHPLYDAWKIQELLDCNPMDLSGGEATKVVLYCMIAKNPDLILLDEPTRGLDPYAKQQFITQLSQAHQTVICATHDLVFAAEFATDCVLMFDGSIAASEPPETFFVCNDYYTTPVSRCIRNTCKTALTYQDVMTLCCSCI